jgi:outer membrane protein OmpA-like peptidoglycan-associated protein
LRIEGCAVENGEDLEEEKFMRKVLMVALIAVMANMSVACVASKKFVRKEVKTTSDTLNARLDTTNGEVSEVKDGVSRVDGRVTAVDGRVSQLDSKTNERFEGVKGEIGAVDQKAAGAQTAAERAASDVSMLDEKFQNRNQFAVATEKSILFRFDSAKLDSKYQTDLQEIASMIEQNPNAMIVLEGRTDSKGDKDYNVKLGERRVESVKRFLAVEKGIPIYRIHQISFGADKPVAENKSREGREQNRAVVVTILVPKAGAAAASASKIPQQ